MNMRRNTNGRRSNIEVMADILRMEQASKTHIMYRVGMSYAQLRKYLDYMVKKGFLDWGNGSYPGGMYTITEEGRGLLQSIEKIEEILYSEEITAPIPARKNGNGSHTTSKSKSRQPVLH